MEITADIREVKGVGEKTAALFNKIGIRTVADAIAYYPRDYERFEEACSLDEAFGLLGENESRLVSVIATVNSPCQVRKVKNLSICTLVLRGSAGASTPTLNLAFFNMPYVAKMLKSGNRYVFRGRIEKFRGSYQMAQPKIYKEAEYSGQMNTLQPRYPLTFGLTNHTVARTLKQIFSSGLVANDALPPEIIEKYELLDYATAIRKIHFPGNHDELVAARRRLVFEEFYTFLLAVHRLREETKKEPSKSPMLEVADTARLIEALPYRLTIAQERVWKEISVDLSGQFLMNRLVQGDVGSGKTIIAVLALLMAAANGFQGAIMAPTEVLATQHFAAIKAMSEKYRLPLAPILLTGSVKGAARKAAYEQIKAGAANVIIGTHALITDGVEYHNLALVVTDEQHRFGVRQRESLAGKGKSVHVLALSATPIPRSLALIIYGDLDISVLEEKPASRLPVKNCVVGHAYRDTAYKFIVREVEAGHQAYVICPMVEEGELVGAENVADYSARLASILPERIRIGSLTGKMRQTDKNRLMADFASGNIDVLVSTTVIEVGIDVANATVIMIENAERFGLSQLHQLRGRVGRGEAQSYCIFVSSNESQEALSRLNVLNESNDGFRIANEDLRLRGPGDLFGIRQSGLMSFRLGDIYQDAGILKEAEEAVSLTER